MPQRVRKNFTPPLWPILIALSGFFAPMVHPDTLLEPATHAPQEAAPVLHATESALELAHKVSNYLNKTAPLISSEGQITLSPTEFYQLTKSFKPLKEGVLRKTWRHLVTAARQAQIALRPSLLTEQMQRKAQSVQWILTDYHRELARLSSQIDQKLAEIAELSLPHTERSPPTPQNLLQQRQLLRAEHLLNQLKSAVTHSQNTIIPLGEIYKNLEVLLPLFKDHGEEVFRQVIAEHENHNPWSRRKEQLLRLKTYFQLGLPFSLVFGAGAAALNFSSLPPLEAALFTTLTAAIFLFVPKVAVGFAGEGNPGGWDSFVNKRLDQKRSQALAQHEQKIADLRQAFQRFHRSMHAFETQLGELPSAAGQRCQRALQP